MQADGQFYIGYIKRMLGSFKASDQASNYT